MSAPKSARPTKAKVAKKKSETRKRSIERYEHPGKMRTNNPPVGLVTPETNPPTQSHKVYDYIEPVPRVQPGKELDYDPHLDPQLVWAGKREHGSFEVPTVSLHVQFGKIAPSSKGTYSFTILLRAGRRVNDLDGRRYTIRVSASDNAGNAHHI